MVATLQNQINNLQQERAVPLQSPATSATRVLREGTLPLESVDDRTSSNFAIPPIDQPAIRDEPSAPPPSTTTTFGSPQPIRITNSGHKLKASDFPNFYGKDNEDIDEWIEKVSAIF
jgi:hypothetical protein